MNFIGLPLLEQLEGFRSKPYLCSAGKPTIGFGSTYYENGKRVTLKDKPITEDYARQLAIYNLKSYMQCVCKYVTSKINDEQYSALVIFCYNVGTTEFRTSTLLKLVNINPNDPTIKTEWLKWKWETRNGVKTISPGLINRRNAEIKLYFQI